jgi:hypothetical protein
VKIGQSMPGRRVFPGEDGRLRLAPGDFGKDLSGVWHARPPTMEIAGLEKQQHPLGGNLQLHKVVDHPDGTITVSPSILIEYPYGNHAVKWHGYLERGVWRRVP